jgi:hypothetical protein
MNLRTICEYAAALFVAQILLGFLEGFLFRPSLAALLGGAAASFVVCGAIFAHLGAQQPHRPFSHAWAALLLQVAVSMVLDQILTRWISWIGSTPASLIALGFIVFVVSLLAGTMFGIRLRHKARHPANA